MLDRLLARFAHPMLQRLDPETAHQATIMGLKASQCVQNLTSLSASRKDDPRLQIHAMGLTFSNPLGMAAGFDKQAEVIDALFAMGFGAVEVGGVTPLAQPGNARPRVFRLPDDGAVINRYGLNSEGMAAIKTRLTAQSERRGILGVNIGANKEASDRLADYGLLTGELAPLVDFITVNVSSPNTPGLRDLQGEAFLQDLLKRVQDERETVQARTGHRTRLLLKIAPDMSLTALDALVDTVLKSSLDGMVISNTTVSRPASLIDQMTALETGGLSGRPVFALSTKMLAQVYERIEGRIPLIGVGGIDSGEAAWRKIEAGASLIQLYTALVYQGPALIDDIKQTLLERLTMENLPSLASVVGRRAKEMAQTQA